MLNWILAVAWRGEVWDRIPMKIETKTRRPLWYFIKPYIEFDRDPSKRITKRTEKPTMTDALSGTFS
jgi:hypothetical protein